MTTAFYVYHSPHINAFYNLALEEHILRTRPVGNFLLLWQSANTVVIGRHQNVLAEINREYAEQHGIAVVRRSTGGGAVYHDAGNVNFSFIGNARQSSSEAMHYFTQPVIAALATFGVKAELNGRNDIVVGDKKISGNAQMLLGNRMLHHGTLLYNADLSMLAHVLKVRPEKFVSKGVSSVRSRVGNIADSIPNPPDTSVFIGQLMQHFGMVEGALPLELSVADSASIAAISQDKYQAWEWNYGRSPKSSIQRFAKYAGGIIEIHLEIVKGRIATCVFYGDFMALRPAEEVAAALVGVPFTEGAVQEALEVFARSGALAEYFGSITQDELLHCLFAESV